MSDRSQFIEEANARSCIQQHEERRALLTNALREKGCPIVIFVSEERNAEGSYYATVSNPMLSCEVGFGSTPYRALRELAILIEKSADLILHRYVEAEMEFRVREKDKKDD